MSGVLCLKLAVYFVFQITVTSSIDISIEGSSQYALPGQPFTFTCRFNSSVVAARELRKNGFQVQAVQLSNDGLHNCYNVHLDAPVVCDPSFCSCSQKGDTFTARWTLPSINDSTSTWTCVESASSSTHLILELAVLIAYVSIDPQNVTTKEGGVNHQITCMTSDSYPPATVTWYLLRHGSQSVIILTTGISNTQRNKKTISTLSYTGQAVDNGGRLYCKATNAAQEVPIQSQIVSITVYYPPKTEPVFAGYTTGSILFEGDPDLLLNCQQKGGYPLSGITWLCSGKDVKDNSSDNISSSNMILPVNRDLHEKTCLCSVTYPGNQFNYKGNVSVIFTVLFLTVNESTVKKSYERTDDITIQCVASVHSKAALFSHWTHTVGSKLIRTMQGTTSDNIIALEIQFAGYQDIGTYTCNAESNGNRLKSQDIHIIVNDLPVFTDNITTVETADGSTEIHVGFYSVPKPVNVEWLKDENVLYMSEKYLQTSFIANVSLTVHKVKVHLKGYRSTITVKNSDTKDYGNYVLRVQNVKGTALQKIPYFPEHGVEASNTEVLGVVIGTVLAILVTLGITIFVVYLRHKRRENTSSESTRDKTEDTSTYENMEDPVKTNVNRIEMKQTQSQYQNENQDICNQYEELNKDEAQNAYSELQINHPKD